MLLLGKFSRIRMNALISDYFKLTQCRLPYIAGLVYFSIIFDRWKKGQKPTKVHADPEAELHSLDSRKPFARTHENDKSLGH